MRQVRWDRYFQLCGFTQPGRMDRQELRLVFECRDVRLDEWVPTRATIHAVVDEKQTRELCELFPDAQLNITTSYSKKDRVCSGRHKPLDVYQMIDLNFGQRQPKMHRYGEQVRELFVDQVEYIKDRRHVRRLTEENARDALALALHADTLAHAALTAS
jgi:hypothetical protein